MTITDPRSASLTRATTLAQQVLEEVDTEELLAELSVLVDMESPTYAIEHCDRVAERIGAHAEASGAVVELVAGANGVHLHAQLRGTGRAKVALLCHHDTVFPLGTTDEWSFSRQDGRVYGPGVCDMKGGIIVALYTLRALRARPDSFAVVELVSVPDEEERNGAPETIDRLRDFDAVLCLECGRADGSIVSERKGGLWTKLVAHGRAAHAGVAPDTGRNAVAALAAEAVRLQALHHARPGLTAQVTGLRGGVGTATVPPEAELVIDVRAVSSADLQWASQQLEPRTYDGITIDRHNIGANPAMERTPPVRHLAAAARALGDALGAPFDEASTGGSSDGAWTAGMGVPTIDGLGPVGGDDHSRDEFAEIASFAPRCAVTAGLICATNDGLLNIDD